MLEAAYGRDETRRTRVFLSYSRKDKAFVRKLAGALIGGGYVADFDQSEDDPDNVETGISAEDEWWRRLQQMIAAAEAIVLVVSPDSAASPACDEEIAYARALGKRVIPILLRPIDFAAAPPRLAALNVKIAFVSDAEFEPALKQLCAVLDLDVAWNREGRRLIELAVRWREAGEPESELLRSGAVSAAETWSARRPAGAPEPSEILLDFLGASRAKEKVDRDARNRLVQRGFVAPVEAALQAGRAEAALRLVAAGGAMSDDEGFSLEAATPEPHRFALWRAGLRAAAQQKCLAALRGHQAAITSVAFSPDGRRILTSSSDALDAAGNTVRVWDAETGAQIAVMRGHERWIHSVAFSPDGARVLSGSGDGTARIWDAATGAQVAALRGHERDVMSVGFSPDGTRALTGSRDRTARIWDAVTGVQIAVLSGHSDIVGSVAFSPDGTRALTAGDLSPIIWDVATAEKVGVLTGHKGPVMCLAFSRDGTLAITGARGDWDHTARVWNVAAGVEIAILHGHKHELKSVAFDSDGKRALTVGLDGAARIWDVETGAEISVMDGDGRMSSAAFSPDGTRVLTGGRTTRLWDAKTGAEIAILRGHERDVTSVAFSPAGARALTGSHDGVARLWDLALNAEIRRHGFDHGSAADVSFGAAGSCALFGLSRRLGGRRDMALVRDLVSSEDLAVLPHESGVNAVALSPDLTRALTGDVDGSAHVWNIDPARRIAVLRGHEAAISCVAFSPDGARALTGSFDRSVRAWDSATGAQICVFRNHGDPINSVAFSPCNGRALSTSGQIGVGTVERDFAVRFWDVDTGAEIAVLRGHEARVNGAAFSPDGARGLTGSSDGTARIWNLHAGAEIAVLRTHGGAVRSVAFSPLGNCVLTGSDDGSVRLWDGATGAEIAALKQESVLRVAFTQDGRRALTAAGDGAVREWDVSRWAAMTEDRAVFLAAALDCGIGFRCAAEQADLLMQDAPDDLFAAFMQRLTPVQRQRVPEISRRLRARLHAACYLPSKGEGDRSLG